VKISKTRKDVNNQEKSVLEYSDLKNSDHPYFQLYEHVSTPIVVLSATFTIEYLNRAAEDFYNVKRDKSIGKNCYDEFDCNLFEETGACPIPEVLRQGKSVDMRLSKHLGVANCYVRAFPIRGNRDEIISVVIEDFSRLTAATTHAIELESRFRKTVELAVDPIFVLGENFIIEFANSAAIAMLGEQLENIKGKDFREYLNDEKVIKFLEENYYRAGTYESICYYSERSVLFGKENLSIVEMCITKAIEGGDQVKIYVYLHDITEEKKLQNNLMQTNEFLSNLINRSVDGIIAVDMKGNIIIFNESAEKLFGYTAEEAKENVHITKIYRPGFAKEIMRMLRSEDYGGVGKMETIEAIAVNKDGEEIPCNLSAAIIYDKDGKEVASVGIFSDLRERKLMQRELEETHMKLLQSEKMSSLGKLAAGIAHEINNPLGGIMIFANMMLEEMEENEERSDDLKRIVSEATRCKNIVKGLLEFSRQTDSKMELNDLNRLLEQGMALLENQSIFHNIKIVKDFDKALPLVNCDSARLSQVFINFILNAVDAMGKKGTFTIKTNYKKDKNTAVIEFTDTGCGIPEEIINKIFDPFFTTKEVGEGTGLGLSMSYGIIKDHGGTIDIRSKVGEGTTFIIELPVGE
jgi:two-component system NtrC family sensor kinase